MLSTPKVVNCPVGSIADQILSTSHAMKVSELAEILNVSRAFLYRLAADRRLPSFRLGGAVRFDPKAVAAWLRKDRGLDGS